MSRYVGFIPFLLSLFLYITVGPFVLFFILLNEIVRLIVSIYLKFKYNGELFLIPSGNDAIFAGNIPGKTKLVLLGYRYKGKIEKNMLFDIYDRIQNQVDSDGNFCYKRMEYLLTEKLGYGCWQIDQNFDLNNHVKFLSDTKVHSHADILKILKDISEDMDPTHAQWDCVVVPRYKGTEDLTETGWMFCRFNHAYMDGCSVIMLLEKFFTKNFTYYVNPVEFRIPSWKKFLFYLNSVIFGPSAIVYGIIDSYRERWPLLPVPKGRKVEKHFCWTADLNIDYVHAIRKATDTTLSSVVENAFISAAIKTLPSKRVPEEWHIGEVAALLPYKDFRPQNRFTGFTYMINSLDDDFTRLKKSKQAAWEGMISPLIPLVYASFSTLGRMPLSLHDSFLSSTASTFFFSNVPSSKTKITGVGNTEVVEVFGFPPTPNSTGISIGCTTYVNSIKIACAALSNWLRKEELEDIMKKVPGIIKEWADTAEGLCLKAKTNIQ